MESTENETKPLRMFGLYPSGITGLEEFGQTLVLEVSNHVLIVTCYVTGFNAFSFSIVVIGTCTGVATRGLAGFDQQASGEKLQA